MNIDFIPDNSDGSLPDLVRPPPEARFWTLEEGIGFFVGEVSLPARLARSPIVEEGCRLLWPKGLL